MYSFLVSCCKKKKILLSTRKCMTRWKKIFVTCPWNLPVFWFGTNGTKCHGPVEEELFWKVPKITSYKYNGGDQNHNQTSLFDNALFTAKGINWGPCVHSCWHSCDDLMETRMAIMHETGTHIIGLLYEPKQQNNFPTLKGGFTITDVLTIHLILLLNVDIDQTMRSSSK